MTQAKKTKAPMAKPNLQQQFLALSPVDQQGVTNFFNAHNIAHFIYENLTEEAQKYVSYCIRLSQQADKIEKQNSAQVS